MLALLSRTRCFSPPPGVFSVLMILIVSAKSFKTIVWHIFIPFLPVFIGPIVSVVVYDWPRFGTVCARCFCWPRASLAPA